MDGDNGDFAQWVTPKVQTRMWWCGDPVCDCTQPQVELIEPNLTVGFPWIHRTPLWEGEFHSEATVEEYEAQQQALGFAGLLLAVGVQFGGPT